jgi:hypothetical protein
VDRPEPSLTIGISVAQVPERVLRELLREWMKDTDPGFDPSSSWTTYLLPNNLRRTLQKRPRVERTVCRFQFTSTTSMVREGVGGSSPPENSGGTLCVQGIFVEATRLRD